jgi:hypothetical protein
MLLIMLRAALVAGLLTLNACANCAAGCSDSVTLWLQSPLRMPSYRFEMTLDGRTNVVTCRFDQPGPCSGFGMRVRVEEGRFVIETLATPRTLTLVVTADTQSQRFQIEPSYREYEVCGADCRAASESRTLAF